jgi:hypothetical protein
MNKLPKGYVTVWKHNLPGEFAACFDGGKYHGFLMVKDGKKWLPMRPIEAWERPNGHEHS